LVAWFLDILGHWLLFAPVITLLKWIPLVGYFLGSIASFAALLFAVVWVTFLHFLLTAVAWIFYRPMYGFVMLLFEAIIGFLMTL
jgi:hypothetical protein